MRLTMYAIDLGVWPRYAPGACIRRLQRHPAPTRAERAQVAATIAKIKALELTAAGDVAWFPRARETGDAWPPGYLVGVRATRTPGAGLVPEGLMAAARTWVAGLVGLQVDLSPWHVEYVDLPPGEDPRGESGGLAVAAALVAGVLGRAFRETPIVSARLGVPGPGASILTVGKLAAKGAIVADEAPGRAHLVAACGGSAVTWLERHLGVDWRESLLRALGSSAHALADDSWARYRRGDRDGALRSAVAVTSAGVRERGTARAWWVVGASQLHAGQSAEGVVKLEEALRLLRLPQRAGDDPPEPYESDELEAFLGVGYLDCGRPGRARERLQAALDALTTSSDDKTWRKVVLQVAGSLHRACVLDGDLPEAARAIDDFGLSRARLKEEYARCLGDRAEVYRRAGAFGEARRCLREARRALPDVPDAARALTERFLQVYSVRAGEAVPNWPIVQPRWAQWPQPAETMETLLVGPPDALAAWMERFVLHEDIRGVFLMACLGVAARAATDRGSTPMWACALGDRLAALPGAEPGVTELGARAAAGDVSAWLARAPY